MSEPILKPGQSVRITFCDGWAAKRKIAKVRPDGSFFLKGTPRTTVRVDPRRGWLKLDPGTNIARRPEWGDAITVDPI